MTDIKEHVILVAAQQSQLPGSADAADIAPHAANHQYKGNDQINVTLLQGILAEPQKAGYIVGLPITDDLPMDQQALVWDSTEEKYVWTTAGIGGGEANVASNEGIGVGTVAMAKQGVELPFKSFLAGTGILIENGSEEITISTTGEANTNAEYLWNKPIDEIVDGDTDGVQVADTEENLIGNSENLAGTGWNQERTTLNTSTGIPSDRTADYTGIISNTVDNYHAIQRLDVLDVATYKYCIDMKAGAKGFGYFLRYSATSGVDEVRFNLETLETSAIPAGLDFYITRTGTGVRLHSSFDCTVSESNVLSIGPAVDLTDSTYAGDASTVEVYAIGGCLQKSDINGNLKYVVTPTSAGILATTTVSKLIYKQAKWDANLVQKAGDPNEIANWISVSSVDGDLMDESPGNVQVLRNAGLVQTSSDGTWGPYVEGTEYKDIPVAYTINSGAGLVIGSEALVPDDFASTKPASMLIPTVVLSNGVIFARGNGADYNAPTGKIYYVDGTNGDNGNDGLTPVTSLRSIDVATAKSDVDEVWLASGDYDREEAMRTPPTRDITLKCYDGRARLLGANFLAWAVDPTYPNTYKATRSAVYNFVDSSVLNKYGYPLEYTEKASAAEVNAEEVSWYTDGASVWINTHPDSSLAANDLLALLTVKIFDIQDTSIYVENIDFIGGEDIDVNADAGATRQRAGFKDCTISYQLGNGMKVLGNIDVVSENVESALNGDDGFNYHIANSNIPTGIEVNCKGFANGDGVETVDNGSSIHDGGHVARFGGEYYDNNGPNVADVNTSYSWNVMVSAWGGVQPTNNHDFYIDGYMWLTDCRGNIFTEAIGTLENDNPQAATQTMSEAAWAHYFWGEGYAQKADGTWILAGDVDGYPMDESPGNIAAMRQAGLYKAVASNAWGPLVTGTQFYANNDSGNFVELFEGTLGGTGFDGLAPVQDASPTQAPIIKHFSGDLYFDTAEYESYPLGQYRDSYEYSYIKSRPNDQAVGGGGIFAVYTGSNITSVKYALKIEYVYRYANYQGE